MPYEYYVDDVVYRMDTITREIDHLNLDGEWSRDPRNQSFAEERFYDGVAWVSDAKVEEIRKAVKSMAEVPEYREFVTWLTSSNTVASDLPVIVRRAAPGQFQVMGYGFMDEGDVPEEFAEAAVNPLDPSIEQMAKEEGGWDDDLDESPADNIPSVFVTDLGDFQGPIGK